VARQKEKEDAAAWEWEIDLLVYESYGLTKGKIAIVEKATA